MSWWSRLASCRASYVFHGPEGQRKQWHGYYLGDSLGPYLLGA